MSKQSGHEQANEDEGRPLTAKQAHFAQLVADGATQSDAYREAYNTKPDASANSINVSASRLAKLPHVSKRIEDLKAKDLGAQLANDKLTQQWIMDRLREEATSKRNAASVRVRALELLGKNQKMFGDDATVVIQQRTPEEIERDIMRMVANILDMD